MDLPILITPDANAELASTIAIWESIAGKTLIPGQPDYLLAANLAYQKYLMIQRLNAAFCNMLIDFAASPILDYIVALVGVSRISPQPATCTLQFTLVTGHGTLTISAGTRVSSTDGLAVFEVDQDTLVDASVDTITANATCQTDGIIGNNYVIGAISTIMDTQPYLSSCTNIDVTASGIDTESDDELRARAKMATSIFSVAGPRDAYEYYIKTVSPLICDVAIITAQDDLTVAPGEVDIYALLDDGQIPSTSLNDFIESTLSNEKIRPLTDSVVVMSPSPVHFDITIEVTKLKNYSGTADSIISAISALMSAYRITKYSKLGIDIIASEIESICRIIGVYDLVITITPPSGKSLTGRNLIIEAYEFGYMDNVNISVTGSNNG